MLLLQLHDLLVHALLVVLVLLPQLLDAGLQHLHGALGLHRPHEEREDQDPDNHDDDRDGEGVREEAVLAEDRCEDVVEEDDAPRDEVVKRV